MSIETNAQIVKNFLAALARRDKQALLALSAEDIEWIIPGEARQTCAMPPSTARSTPVM